MNFRNGLAQALREPLFHFLIAGGVIFALFSWSGNSVDASSRRIIVDEEQVQRLATLWSQTWRRPPTGAELDGLIRDYIKEEVYYREAKRLGLDEDDIIVRRRLRSKMEFLAMSEAENMVPSDALLQAWLDKYPARYATDPVVSFDSVYIASDGTDDVARNRALDMLAQLKQGSDPATLGDAISLPRSMDAASQDSIRQQFGDDFAAAILSLPMGQWSGPIQSGFGLHLVRIRHIDASRKPALTDVRQRLENDWRAATKEQRENSAYQKLLDGYDIEIAQPK